VFLALDDDLLSTINELLAPPFGEVLLRKEGLCVIIFLADAILMLLGNLVGEAVL